MRAEAESNGRGFSDDDIAQVGIIEKIKLENFMCHQHLELKLGPNINFIIGVNGSGKSAILVALTVCLGAKAGFTNRGKKITNFIRGQASSASVSVTLRNRGTEAFKPETYGKSITITRTIARSGASSYKIKNEQGKTMSTTKYEVVMILEQFNIQIENPCVILMQDTSRAFLNSSKPTEKYAFFLKATQLEQIRFDYNYINAELEAMNQTLERKKSVLPGLKKRKQELERQHNEAEKLRGLENELKKLRSDIVWAQIQEQERHVDEAQKKVEAQQAEIDKYKSGLEKIKEATQKLNAECESRQKEVDETGAHIRKANEEAEAHRAKITELRRTISQHQSKVKDLSTRRDAMTKRIKKLQDFINEVQEKAMRDTQAEKEERQQKIEEYQGELRQIREKAESLEAEIGVHETERSKLDAQLKETVSKEREIVNEVKALGEQIRILELQKSDRTRCFGRNMPALLDAINGERRWCKKPIGPLGLCFSITDDKWAAAIEIALGRALTSFVVDNHDDERLLKDLGKRVGQVPDMFVQSFRDSMYSLPPSELPPRQLTTVLSQIKAEHPMVYNVLIDQRQIEAQVLIPDREQATNIIFHQQPKNTKEGYLPDGSRLLVRGGAEVFNAGSVRTRRLGRNFDERIQELRHGLEAKENEAARFAPFVRELKTAIDTNARALTQLRGKRAALKRDENRLDTKIVELESVREEAPPDISESRASIETHLRDKESIEAELAQAKEEAQKIEEQIRPWQEKFDEKRQEIEQLAHASQKIAKKLQSVHEKITTISTKEKQMQHHTEKLIQAKKQEELRVAELIKKLEDDTQVAEQSNKICSRPREKLPSLDQINAKIHKLQTRLELQQEGQRSADEIKKDYDKACAAFKKAEDGAKKLTGLSVGLKKRLMSRMKCWRNWQRAIATRTTLHFHNFLSRKNYAGSLTFNHEESSLNIEVQLDASHGSQVSRDTRTLSGGERSFSTVALLLALWEAMESPFRAMDEFDVFMDAVNRHMSLKLLIESAREQKHRQFIFITPHDLTSVAAGPDVRVNRMRDPERNIGGPEQTTLDQLIQS